MYFALLESRGKLVRGSADANLRTPPDTLEGSNSRPRTYAGGVLYEKVIMSLHNVLTRFMSPVTLNPSCHIGVVA